MVSKLFYLSIIIWNEKRGVVSYIKSPELSANSQNKLNINQYFILIILRGQSSALKQFCGNTSPYLVKVSRENSHFSIKKYIS